jgi:hypothetical protein
MLGTLADCILCLRDMCGVGAIEPAHKPDEKPSLPK